MRRTSKALFLPALVAVGLAAAACGSSSAGSASSTRPVSGGTVVYGSDREPNCLDPHDFGDIDQAELARQYLDSLVAMRPDGSVVPWLASSWTISPDGKTYTFQLKHGVSFTDGTAFDAQAVQDNITQMFAPATHSGTDLIYLAPIYQSSAAISTYTFRLSLKTPYAPLLDALSQAYFGIESPKAMARGEGANCQSPVGTGAFIVENWVHGQQVDLVRNPNYDSAPADAKHQGPAYAAELVWRFLEQPDTRVAALQDGQAQVISAVPPEENAAVKADSAVSVQQFVHAGQGVNVTLNTSRGPFTSLPVRQAFLYASNARAAVQSAYLGALPAATTTLSTTTPDYDPSLAGAYPYSEAEANRLLDQAGWTGRDAAGFRTKDGQELTVETPYGSTGGATSTADLTLLEDIQAAEKLVGINVDLVPTPTATFDADYGESPTYDAFMAYFNSPTPAVLSILYSPKGLANTSFVNDPPLTSLLAQAVATTDTTTQKSLYTRAQQIIQANAWSLNLYPETTQLAISDRLHGVWIEPSEGEPVLSDAWLG